MSELLQYFSCREILGDGAKYVEINGEMIPLNSSSATERVKHGERRNLLIRTDSKGFKAASLADSSVKWWQWKVVDGVPTAES